MRFDQVSNLVKEYGFQLSLGDQVMACRMFPVNELLLFSGLVDLVELALAQSIQDTALQVQHAGCNS